MLSRSAMLHIELREPGVCSSQRYFEFSNERIVATTLEMHMQHFQIEVKLSACAAPGTTGLGLT